MEQGKDATATGRFTSAVDRTSSGTVVEALPPLLESVVGALSPVSSTEADGLIGAAAGAASPPRASVSSVTSGRFNVQVQSPHGTAPPMALPATHAAGQEAETAAAAAAAAPRVVSDGGADSADTNGPKAGRFTVTASEDEVQPILPPMGAPSGEPRLVSPPPPTEVVPATVVPTAAVVGVVALPATPAAAASAALLAMYTTTLSAPLVVYGKALAAAGFEPELASELTLDELAQVGCSLSLPSIPSRLSHPDGGCV
jgi:hypothetical protein